MDAETLCSHLTELERVGRKSAHGAGLNTTRRVGQLAVMSLAGETVSVAMDRVLAMLRAPDVVPVPGATKGLLGAVRHGTRMVAVLEPSRLTGATAAGRLADCPNLVVLRLDEGSIAVPVDAVHGVTDASDDVPELDPQTLVQLL